jgi:formylglycine-generating enzyme required for sulfatase activity
MSGNVWEWCWDFYYSGGDYGYRVLRGGDWYGYASHAAVSFRFSFYPIDYGSIIGFRVVCPPSSL